MFLSSLNQTHMKRKTFSHSPVVLSIFLHSDSHFSRSSVLLSTQIVVLMLTAAEL